MTNTSTDLDPLLGTKHTSVSLQEAKEILNEHYGISNCTITALASERDGNFSVVTNNNIKFLLKITNPAEDESVTNLQTSALRHLEKRVPELPVPRLITSLTQEDELILPLSNGEQHVVRLMSFLPGKPLSLLHRPARLRSQIATALAQLNIGLRNFDHPAAKHDLLWDVTKATRVRPMLVSVANSTRRELALRILDDYESHTVPRLHGLRSQLIHNDFNPSNILVRDGNPPSIGGIIDFGDVIWAPLINDLATAAAYQSVETNEPIISTLVELVVCYHRVLKLTSDELEVLFDLVLARQVMVIAITEWRAAHQPSNRNYILRNTEQVDLSL